MVPNGVALHSSVRSSVISKDVRNGKPDGKRGGRALQFVIVLVLAKNERKWNPQMDKLELNLDIITDAISPH
ncbi:hypothetical protein TYRP_002765 [Tyrophagus putrescentiae]|nr:hypothetical protein TYRP_002765 [Tyrophagus putrescentiae]